MPRLIIEDQSIPSLLRTGVTLELDGRDLGRVACGARADFHIAVGRHVLRASAGRAISPPIHFNAEDRQSIGFICKVSGALVKSVSLVHSFARGSGGRFGAKPTILTGEVDTTAPFDPTAWHHVLGVKATAPIDEVRRAYLKLMRRFHPDQTATGDFESKLRAEESARRLNVAYETAKKERSRTHGEH